jgi:hypothetical protein
VSIRLEHINRVDRAEWLSIWENCRFATFYEHPDWFDSWKMMFPNSLGVQALVFEFSDSCKVLIPGLPRKILKGVQTILESGPGGLYAGPLSTDNRFSSGHLAAIESYYVKSNININLRLNPLICENLHINDAAGSFTQIIDLEREATDLKSVWQSSGVNYDRRIAQKKGVRVERTGPNDLDTFFSVYSTLKLTWQDVSTEYKKSFFEKLISSDQAEFWAIYVHDVYIGGGILVKGVNHVSSWLTIVHPDYTSFRPYEFFYTTVIEHYRELGFKWFDFNPSAGLTGVVRFKEKFGCDQLPFFTLKSRTAFTQFIDYVRGWNV